MAHYNMTMSGGQMRITRERRLLPRGSAWVIVGAGLLAIVTAFSGVEGVAVALLVLALFIGLLAGWMVLGVATAGMNSQGVAFIHFREQRMHYGPDDAARTHAAGIRIVVVLALLSAALFALGFPLRYAASAL